MRRSQLLAFGLTAALAFSATPAFAQHRGGGGHGGGGHASVRAGAARSFSGGVRASAPRGSFAYRGGVYGGRFAGPRFYGGGRFVSVAPVRFYRPYYAFRPRLSLGFGLWMGYPIAYDYPYYDPYYSPYAVAEPYPPAPYPSGATPGYSVAPSAPPNAVDGTSDQANQTNMGGLSFQITPAEAQVLIDGRALGTAGQFTPTSQPLGVPAGHHHVEVRASGYQTMSFDVDVVAGQVLPFQGTMER